MAKKSFKNTGANKQQGKGPVRKEIGLFPKQALFVQCEATEVLFGGAAGPGKTYAQLIDAMYYAYKYPGSKQLYLRESFPELERSAIMESYKLYPQEFAQYNSQTHTWYWYKGSSIEFGYLENDSDVSKYQSAEYDVIRFDEGTHFNEFRYMYMKSRCRGANDFPKQIKTSSNPGGIGHKFFKKRFGIGTEEPYKTFSAYIGEDKFGTQLFETRCFIPASIYDNPILMEKNPDYIKNLMQLPETERNRLLDGSWDENDDAAFPEFDRNIHVINGAKVFPMGIPKHWKRWLSVDNGYDDPFAWYWFAVSEDGTVFIYREFTREQDDKGSKLLYDKQAEKVVERSTYIEHEDGREVERQEKFQFVAAGHDAWNTHHRDESGKTFIDYYNAGGLYGFLQGSKDRRLRKLVWHQYLAPFKDPITGKMTAKLQIFDNCKKLIETIPEMIRDPDDPEKVLDVEDHWYDGAGYGLVALHAKKSKALKSDMNDIQKHKANLAKRLKTGRNR